MLMYFLLLNVPVLIVITAVIIAVKIAVLYIVLLIPSELQDFPSLIEYKRKYTDD